MMRWNPHWFMWFFIAVMFGCIYWFFVDATLLNFGISFAIIEFVLIIVQKVVEEKRIYMFTERLK